MTCTGFAPTSAAVCVVGMFEPVTMTRSASDVFDGVAGVGEGDDRLIASCPRALAAIKRDTIKQNR